MKRTTIFLAPQLLKRLKALAHRRGVSFATVVREAMARYLVEPAAPGTLPSVTGRFASGRSDVSERAEELLWKDPHA